MIETTLQDVRYSLRVLRQQPRFSIVAILTLALGIGANTAIFSIVDAAVLRPLPYPHSERLVAFTLDKGSRQSSGVMPADFLDWRDQQQVFDQIVTEGGRGVALLGGNEPEGLRVARVSAGFFEMYGVASARGRVFVRDDEQEGHDKKIIVTDEFWNNRLGRDSKAIGRALRLDNVSYEVVGVLPAGFRFPADGTRTEVFMPMTFTATDRQHGVVQSMGLGCVGRLKSGVTVAQAEARMSDLQARLDTQHVAFNKGYTRVELTPLLERYVGDARAWMLMLLGAVVLVLLIACANVANLVIAHSSTRVRELTVRAAIGASRARIAMQLLTESLVLSTIGGAAGIIVAWFALRLLQDAMPASIPRGWSIGLDLRVLSFTAVVAIATGILCGLLPALRGYRVDLVSGLKEGSGATTNPRRHRIRQVLACAEITLAVMLLIGAGLFIASFAHIAGVDRGFDGSNVTTVSISLPRSTTASPATQVYFQDLKSSIERVAGVEEVAMVEGGAPLQGGYRSFPLTVVGRPSPPAEGAGQIRFTRFSAAVFDMLRVPLRRGRLWTEHDSASTPLVAVINEAAATRFWRNEDPIGQRLIIEKNAYEIIGIVRDMRYASLVQTPQPEVYLAFEQNNDYMATFLVRASHNSEGLNTAIKAAVWNVNPGQPVKVGTIDQNYRDITASRRFNMLLMSAFGLLALSVAATGIYGVMSFLVATRRHEMAVRLALGAEPRQVADLIVRQSTTVIVVGVVAGLMGAWWLSQTAQSFLFEVRSRDPVVFAASAVLLALVAAAASWIPARRAGRTNPIEALKTE